jgi:signal transduction histidine kinase
MRRLALANGVPGGVDPSQPGLVVEATRAVADLLAKYWPVVAGVCVGGWTMARSWLRERDLSDKAKGELITIAQNAAKDVIHTLEEDSKRLRTRVDELEDEVRELQKSGVTKDAELSLVRGELRQWKAVAAAYEKLLEANGIPHEKPSQPFWRLDAGDRPEAETR